MKRRAVPGIILVGLLGAAAGVGVAGSAQEVTRFAVVIMPSADGARLTCESGCSWKELSFSCGGLTPCEARVDQDGVGGVSDRLPPK